MITQEQVEKYNFQQTRTGRNVVEMLEYLKKQYCDKLHIPITEIKTGKLRPLVNGKTGELDRFFEE